MGKDSKIFGSVYIVSNAFHDAIFTMDGCHCGTRGKRFGGSFGGLAFLKDAKHCGDFEVASNDEVERREGALTQIEGT